MTREFRVKKFLNYNKQISINYFGTLIAVDGRMFDNKEPRFIVTDSSGFVYAYYYKPFDSDSGVWLANPSDPFIGQKIGHVEFTGDWRRSLAKMKDIVVRKDI